MKRLLNWFHVKIKLGYMKKSRYRKIAFAIISVEPLEKSMAAIILGYACQHGGYTAI